MGSTILQPLPPEATYTDELIFRLSVDQYHQLIEADVLTEDDPVELLDGMLVYKMSKNTPHSTATRFARRSIEPQLTAGCFYDSQEPITLTDSEPEPDGVIVRGRIEDYALHHPRAKDVLLVLEIADASLERDRGIKLRVYARAGIKVYWLLNLIDRRLEVYTDPDAHASTPGYRRFEVFTEGQSVSALLPDHPPINVRVADLLPPLG